MTHQKNVNKQQTGVLMMNVFINFIAKNKNKINQPKETKKHEKKQWKMKTNIHSEQ